MVRKTALVLLVMMGAANCLSQVAPKEAACAEPEYHQFDFFVGDWDAFDSEKPGKMVARNRVESILEGCVVLEDYEGRSGHHGESFSIYDATKKVWHQTWVTNRGELLLLDGDFRDGQLILSGHDLQNGRPRDVRGTWKIEDGGVRETAVESFDGGKRWKPWFDLMFRPHKK
jgi:hypothetical protein